MKKLALFIFFVVLAGCAAPARYGMVKDEQTGLQYGSTVERNIFIDSTQFANKKVRVTTRNVSGDEAYQLRQFNSELTEAVRGRGYQPTAEEAFGIRFDVNVLYSGQVQKNMGSEFGFLGGASGAVAGYQANTRGGTAAGALVGATLGSIIGSNVTDDTYIVIAEVSIGVAQWTANDRTSITFSSSPPLQRPTERALTPFREVLRTKVAVYAGGRNVRQSQVSGEMRRRLVDIVSNTM